MARFKDGLRIPTNLFEAAAFHQAVKPVCRCGHSATFGPHGLWWRFHKKGWDDGLNAAREHFWCRKCGAQHGQRFRPIRLDLVRETTADIQLELLQEHEWKRAVNMFRS